MHILVCRRSAHISYKLKLLRGVLYSINAFGCALLVHVGHAHTFGIFHRTHTSYTSQLSLGHRADGTLTVTRLS